VGVNATRTYRPDHKSTYKGSLPFAHSVPHLHFGDCCVYPLNSFSQLRSSFTLIRIYPRNPRLIIFFAWRVMENEKDCRIYNQNEIFQF
jgi:hypothetical protein